MKLLPELKTDEASARNSGISRTRTLFTIVQFSIPMLMQVPYATEMI